MAKLSVPRNRLGNSSLEDCGRVLTLQVLDLSSNGISLVSAAIGALAALVELVLDDNSIEVLPPECSQLVRLKTLSLRNNRITGDTVPSSEFQPLPKGLFTDTGLERLNLEGNPILRRQLLEFAGVDAWLERCSKTKQKDIALYMGQ